jgi:hypothetical protein
VASFFNPATRTIDQAKLSAITERLGDLPTVDSEEDKATHQVWPSVPLGSVLWLMASDRRGVGPYGKAWLTGTVEICIRSMAHLITFCPNHRALPRRVPAAREEVLCPHCDFKMCADCRLWHSRSKNCSADPPGTKRCPFCRVAIVKTSGCNHITCRCGKHWCFYCGQGFNTPTETYSHMKAAHGGYYAT